MATFIYDGNAVEDTDINESVSYKIEDHIMTLYENGMLVDNATLGLGDTVEIKTSDEEVASIIVTEAKVDEAKGFEILKELGIPEDQIGNFIANNSEGYENFIKLLGKARREVDIDQVKDVLRTSIGMTDEQINELVDRYKGDFSKFAKIVNAGKKIVEKDAAAAAAEVQPDGVDSTVNPDMTTPEVPATDVNADVNVDANAAETDATTPAAPVEPPVEGAEDQAAPVDNVPTEPAPEEVPENPDVQAPTPDAVPAPEVPEAPAEVPPADATVVPAEGTEEAPKNGTPDTDDNTELAPEEKEESTSDSVNGAVVTESVDSVVYGVNGVDPENPYKQYNSNMVTDLVNATKTHDTIAEENITVDPLGAFYKRDYEDLENQLKHRKETEDLQKKFNDASGITKEPEDFGGILDAEIAKIKKPDVAEEDSAATVGAMLPQIGTNCFNDDAREGNGGNIITKKFHGTAIESYLDDDTAEMDVIVENTITDIANNVKTSVALSLHVRKIAIEIAVLNAKSYIAKKYGSNKLYGINAKRRMLRLQKELNKIKNSATKEEKVAIMQLQKAAFAEAKEKAKERIAKEANKKAEATAPDDTKKENNEEVKQESAIMTSNPQLDDLKNRYENAKRRFEESGEVRFEKQMRGLSYQIERMESGNNELTIAHIRPIKENADAVGYGTEAFWKRNKVSNAVNTVVTESTDELVQEYDTAGLTVMSEDRDIEDEIKPIVDLFNKKGYTVKYASPGHVKLRKKPDRNKDGEYYGKLYSDARVQFDKKYDMPTAPDGWFFKDVDGMDYLDVKEIPYNKDKFATPDDAFKAWKDDYMKALKAYADDLPDMSECATESVNDTVAYYESFVDELLSDMKGM